MKPQTEAPTTDDSTYLSEVGLDIGAVSVGRLATLEDHHGRAGNAFSAPQLVTEPLPVQTVQLHRHLQRVCAQTEALAGMSRQVVSHTECVCVGEGGVNKGGIKK